MNNIGVTYLVNGKYDVAISMLLQVLSMMKQSLKHVNRKNKNQVVPTSASAPTSPTATTSDSSSRAATATASATTTSSTRSASSPKSPSEMDIDEAENDEDDDDDECYFDCVPDFWYPSPCTSSEQQPQQQENGMLYMFRHPILLPYDRINNKSKKRLLRESTMAVNCIAIMYNLALAFHLRGSSSGGGGTTTADAAPAGVVALPTTTTTTTVGNSNNNDHITNIIMDAVNDDDTKESDLFKAKSLYELSHQMLQVTDKVDCLPSFVMAISNNMGILHYREGDYAKAQSFFQHLLSTQMFVAVNNVSSCNYADDDDNNEDTSDGNSYNDGEGGEDDFDYFDDTFINDSDTDDDDDGDVDFDDIELDDVFDDDVHLVNSIVSSLSASTSSDDDGSGNTSRTNSNRNRNSVMANDTINSSMVAMDGFWNNTLQLVLATGTAPAA